MLVRGTPGPACPRRAAIRPALWANRARHRMPGGTPRPKFNHRKRHNAIRMETPMRTRRHVLASSAALAAAGLFAPARAQVLKKPVQIIVGFPAGGGTDVIARILAERLRGAYAGTVLVEN